jgi:hypothetical protein
MFFFEYCDRVLATSDCARAAVSLPADASEPIVVVCMYSLSEESPGCACSRQPRARARRRRRVQRDRTRRSGADPGGDGPGRHRDGSLPSERGARS